MLTANPWVTYLSLVTPLLTAYYLLVGFIFYRHDLKARISRWKSPPATAADLPSRPMKPEAPVIEGTDDLQADHFIPMVSEEQDRSSDEPWQNEGLMQQLEELSMHIKQAVEEVQSKAYSKEEFILLAQMTFKEYPALYGTPFQLSVNHLIESELAKYGSIHLSSEDRLRMWHQVD